MPCALNSIWKLESAPYWIWVTDVQNNTVEPISRNLYTPMTHIFWLQNPNLYQNRPFVIHNPYLSYREVWVKRCSTGFDAEDVEPTLALKEYSWLKTLERREDFLTQRRYDRWSSMSKLVWCTALAGVRQISPWSAVYGVIMIVSDKIKIAYQYIHTTWLLQNPICTKFDSLSLPPLWLRL